MDEDSRRTVPQWLLTLQPGSHSFTAVLLLSLLAAATSIGITHMGFLQYIFGTGLATPTLITIFLFTFVLLFRRFILRPQHPGTPSDADAALLEFLTHQNQGQTASEEEMTADLLENAMHLKELRANDCMAPRPEVVHIDVNQSIEALRQLFIDSKLSRILVTDGDLDRVLGYVHVQQLFGGPESIRTMVMPIKFMPETIPVSDILNKFIRNRTSIACVVDEYGSVAGLITLEDALEQLFGEIDDEHDQEEFIDVKISDEEYIFSGRLEVSFLNKKYPELHIPEGDYTTLSGYLVTTAQTIPEQGARIELDGKTFSLELVSDRKIETIRVLMGE
ncbi:MAG: HlyC/CorC family transporter [Lewinellaceae bacterium]|nr:HlyC/CorC family transporter [Lewinellaceae bacterium]